MAGSSWLDLNESSKFGILHGMRLVVSSTCFQKMLLPFVPAGNRLLCSEYCFAALGWVST